MAATYTWVRIYGEGRDGRRRQVLVTDSPDPPDDSGEWSLEQ